MLPSRLSPPSKGNNFLNRLLLMPNGDNLLQPGIKFWIVSAAMIALLMASLEGVTWMAVVSRELPENLKFASILVGLAMGGVVWVADSSFIMFDVSDPNEYNIAENAAPPTSVVKRSQQAKLLVGVALRFLLISISMVVTGPFLIDILQDNQYVANINRLNGEIREQYSKDKQSELSQKYQTDITQKTNEMEAEKHSQQAEIGGKGGTGKTGYGPRAKAHEARIAVIDGEILSLKKEQKEKLAELANKISAMSDQDLEKAGRPIVHNTPEGRKKAGLGAATEAQYDFVLFKGEPRKVITSSLFIFLGLIMLILKLFAPYGAKLYYNSSLQDWYKEYLSGRLGHLPGNTPSADRKMPHVPATKFAEWLKSHRIDIQQRQKASQERDLFLYRQELWQEPRDKLLQGFHDNPELSGEPAPAQIKYIQAEIRRFIDKNNLFKGLQAVISIYEDAVGHRLDEIQLEGIGVRLNEEEEKRENSEAQWRGKLHRLEQKQQGFIIQQHTVDELMQVFQDRLNPASEEELKAIYEKVVEDGQAHTRSMAEFDRPLSGLNRQATCFEVQQKHLETCADDIQRLLDENAIGLLWESIKTVEMQESHSLAELDESLEQKQTRFEVQQRVTDVYASAIADKLELDELKSILEEVQGFHVEPPQILVDEEAAVLQKEAVFTEFDQKIQGWGQSLNEKLAKIDKNRREAERIKKEADEI